jgi:hypothetical protein
MLPRTPKFYLAAVGALMVAGLVGIVTVAAASPKPSASPSGASNAAQTKAQAYCDSFVNHLASNLGKKPDQVKKAISDSLDQTLADAVKAGDLTQQQADAIKAKRNGKQVCAGALAGIGRSGHEGAKARAGLAEIAKALGISPEELKQDLAAGKTVKDVAASKGMDEATFRNNLVNAVKSDLDPKVASGKITQQQEDKILARLKSGPLPLWDSPAKRPGAGKASPKPSPSATTGG